jgi:hypothetical protein
MISMGFGGSGGIRTHGGVPPTLVFKTRALNHSATLPVPHAAAYLPHLGASFDDAEIRLLHSCRLRNFSPSRTKFDQRRVNLKTYQAT